MISWRNEIDTGATQFADKCVTLQTANHSYNLSIFILPTHGNDDHVGILFIGGIVGLELTGPAPGAANAFQEEQNKTRPTSEKCIAKSDGNAKKSRKQEPSSLRNRFPESGRRRRDRSSMATAKRARKTPSEAGASGKEKTAKELAGDEISLLIDKEKWKSARAAIRRELRKSADDHWLWDRLSETYYSEGNINQALKIIKAAYYLNADCPLVLWDYANTLEAMGKLNDARELYRRLIGKGIESVACGECEEGVEWAKALLADTAYRLALVSSRLGKNRRTSDNKDATHLG